MAEVKERQRHAELMVGAVLSSVSYVALDYERPERFPELEMTGPRTITAPDEWADPHWLCQQFGSVDYGVELFLADGRVSSSTWDPPGHIEEIGLRAAPVLGTDVGAGPATGIWDVSGQPRWRAESGFWCTAIRSTSNHPRLNRRLVNPILRADWFHDSIPSPCGAMAYPISMGGDTAASRTARRRRRRAAVPQWHLCILPRTPPDRSCR